MILIRGILDLRSAADKTFRAFKRQVMKVRRSIKDLPDGASLNYRLKVEAGQPTESVFDGPEESSKVRVAVLMWPLLNPDSHIECVRVWELVKQHRDLDPATRDRIDEALTKVNSGGMAFVLNQTPLSQREIFEIFARGEFFHDAADAQHMLRALRFGPMTQMLWFIFYDFVHNMYGVASAVLAAIYSGTGVDEDNADDPRCVYCLSTTGSFTSEEHVIPEAFGNDEAVLPKGWVCDHCNNVCSELDQYLADLELIALQRVLHVPFTKGGKLPRAEFANVTLEKRLPRVVRLIDKTDNPALQVSERGEDGTVQFTINVTSRNPLDPLRLARALFKIALGMVAFQTSRERACEARYDRARTFIRGESHFDNSLLVGLIPDRINEGIEFNWLEAETGTPFGAVFYGVGFFSNLETMPQIQLDIDSEWASKFYVFDLRQDPSSSSEDSSVERDGESPTSPASTTTE